MSATHLPAAAPVRPVASPKSEGASDHPGSRPSDELVDLYSAILITIPLALFLRWLWP